MIGFLNYQCFCPGLNLSALTEWLRALLGAFPNRVFKSEKGYFSTMSLSMLETLGSSSETVSAGCRSHNARRRTLAIAATQIKAHFCRSHRPS